MSANGGGGGCVVVEIGTKYTQRIAFTAEDFPCPIQLKFELPTIRPLLRGTEATGCMLVKIAGVEHRLDCKPSDGIELQFEFTAP